MGSSVERYEYTRVHIHTHTQPHTHTQMNFLKNHVSIQEGSKLFTLVKSKAVQPPLVTSGIPDIPATLPLSPQTYSSPPTALTKPVTSHPPFFFSKASK